MERDFWNCFDPIGMEEVFGISIEAAESILIYGYCGWQEAYAEDQNLFWTCLPLNLSNK